MNVGDVALESFANWKIWGRRVQHQDRIEFSKERTMRSIGILTLGFVLAGVNLVYAGGESVDLGGLKSKTPAGWKKQEPSNKLRMYQFAVPKVEGDKEDAELVV